MSAKPTPGPYTISQVGGGYEIRGIHGVAVGFFGRAWVSGRNGGHSIETPEAEANARAWPCEKPATMAGFFRLTGQDTPSGGF